MTDPEHRLLRAVRDYWKREGYGPTFREIAKEVGWATSSVPHVHARVLRAKGLVAYEDDRARTLRLTLLGEEALA